MKHLSNKQKRTFFIITLVLLVAMLVAPAAFAGSGSPTPVRFATFNASLNRFNAGDLVADLSTPDNAQANTIAEIIQRTRPDVLLINEFDYDDQGGPYDSLAAQLFQDNYLSESHNGAAPIYYPYRFVMPSNTGIPSGRDFNKDGSVGGPDDAFGFGYFPGQYGMAVYSMFPIDYEHARTFQTFLWKDMPSAMLPIDPTTGESWYDEGDLAVFRLSSKSHWDVPILIDGKTVHFLTSHPTPPTFDGAEDRNGTRNNDEIRFWADYVIPSRSSYIYDDQGRTGGITAGDPFVIAGDQNSDPLDGDSVPGSINQLLDHPLVNTKVTPDSEGGPEQAVLQDAANDTHLGDPAFDTADFADAYGPPPDFGGAPGNLRADYVLPRKQLRILDAGVFWPLESDPLFSLVGTYPFPSSDHRLVWVDLTVPSYSTE
jgi:3-phytase/alkaline phosphatase D